MSTGNVESWTGNMSEIGAVYPFVGMETTLMIAGIVFWVWWHICQVRSESRELEEEARKHGNAETMNKVLDSSDPSKR